MALGAFLLAGCISGGPVEPGKPPVPSPPVPSQRDAFLWPFAATSPWNTPVGSAAAFAPTGDPRNLDLLNPGVGTNINAAMWSFPVYRASASDPVRAVTDFLGTATYRIPTSASPAGPQGGDMHMEVVDPTARWLDESWYTTPNGTDWNSGFHQRVDLHGSGVDRGTRAAYVSAVGGLIRTWELQIGVIPHALAFCVSRDFLKMGYVWPANNEDSGAAGTYNGNLPMGSFAAIPPNVNVEALGLSPGGLVIARALQNYGAYLVDASNPGGGPVAFYAEPSADPLLGSARGDMAKIRAQMRVVTNNSPTNVGGGGVPRAPLAPPIA